MSILANTITLLLDGALVIALGVALLSLALMILRWKSPVRRRHLVRLVLALLAIPCLFGIHFANLFLVELPTLMQKQMGDADARRSARIDETSSVRTGDPAPEFSLATVDGNELSLPEEGTVTMLTFFATWCGPCQLELPHIEKLWVANKSNERFRPLVIGRGETTESVREFRDKNGLSFPMAADPDAAIYTLFASEMIPRTFVVSPEGQIVYSTIGFDEDEFGEMITLLQEQLATSAE